MTDVADHPARLSRFATRKTTTARGVRNYSRFVRWARWVAPAAALTIIALVVLWPTIWPQIKRAVQLLPVIINSDARGYHVVNVTMRGVDDDDQPYMITAKTATKFKPDVEEIELSNPNIDVTTKDGEWLYVSGKTGLYRTEDEILELYENVNFYHDNGYEFLMQSAIVDVGEGTAESFEQVEGQGDFGTITSNGITVLERGDVIIFHGPVVLRTHEGALKDDDDVEKPR